MAIQFSVEDRTGLITALANLFGDAEELDAFLQTKLSQVVQYPSPIRDLRFRANFVLQLVDRESLHAAFLQGVLERYPNDKVVLSVYTRLFPGTGAEAKINDLAYRNPAVYRRRIWEIENRICRIEIDQGNGRTPLGTGFLVGKDLVLTNFHVLKPVFSGTAQISHFFFSFDYKLMEDGNPAPVATVQADGQNPVLSSSIGPDMVEDYANHGMDKDWGGGHLDYALVKLAIPMGHSCPGTTRPAEAHEQERGWVSIPEAEVKAMPGNLVIIAQHPTGDYQKISEGHFLSPRTFNAGHTRFRYASNTEKGSSGSPCFNEFWELVGIHHFSDPRNQQAEYNQGIPIGKIREKLAQEGLVLPKYQPKVVVPKPLENATAAHQGLNVAEFLRVAKAVLGGLNDLDTTGPDETVVTSVLDFALKKGKFQTIRAAVADRLAAETGLNEFIEVFAQVSDDPCETVVLPPNAMFLNHQPLRDMLRRLDSPFGNRTIVVREDQTADRAEDVRRGHSHIRKYFNYLRNHTTMVGEVYEVDLLRLGRNASGKVSAADLARLIDEGIDLKDKRWKAGTSGEPEFKQTAFLNSFFSHFDRSEKTFFLVIDSFDHLKDAFDDTVDGLIWGLIEKISTSIPAVRLFLLDYGDRTFPGDIEAIVTTYHLRQIGKNEIVESLKELVRISGERYALPDRDKINLAEKYAELVDYQDKDAFWGGELDAAKVRKVVGSIFSNQP